jgi:hypothetical protein
LSPDARVFVRIDDREIMQRWSRLAQQGAVKPATDLPWREREPSRSPREPKEAETTDRVAGAVTFLDAARVMVDVGDAEYLIIEAKPGTRVYGRTTSDPARSPRVSAGRARGHDVIFCDGGGADAVELPLPLMGREYVPLVIGIVHAGRSRAGVLRATQRLADGELSPGYEINS